MKKTEQLRILAQYNILFGVLGATVFGLMRHDASWEWFVGGWGFMMISFDLLKRIFSMLFELQKNQVRKISPIVYMFILVKISMLGLLLAFLTLVSKVMVVPFVVGILTIVFSGLILGIREAIYARK